ncbi:MAG: hypothetical protein JWO11_3908 [Nocardioides sp.]|nr:hypothetical protein [Nocardioides sp.]
MRVIHDHLYANANIRLPEDLQAEVAKVIQTLTWLAVVDSLPALDPARVSAALAGDRDAATAVAREIRDGFSAFNRTMQRYPARELLKLDDASLAFVRAALVGVDLNDVQRDWLGDALEVFRSTSAKRLGGQFFTDQRVTHLSVELLQFDAANDDLVDICSGTGGFLLAGARAARTQGLQGAPQLLGVEVDASLSHLANTTLHQLGVDNGNPVFNADSLLAPDRWPTALRKVLVPGTHRCLATNPPFGHKITVKDTKLLTRFDLGHVWSKAGTRWNKSKRVSPTAPDILFLEQNLNLAEPGVGRLAIVLPYQILSGPKLGFVREWLLRHAKILAVVDLPETTFQPWTGTKTAVVVVQRRKEPLVEWEPEDYPVFMAVSRHIGHDRRGNPVIGEDGRVICDLPDVEAAFRQHLAGSAVDAHPESFVVSASEFTREHDLRINAAYHEPDRAAALVKVRGTDEEFPTSTIGEVTERIFFPGRFKRNYTTDSKTGVPFLGGTNITQLHATNKKFLRSDDKRLAELRVKSGWILVTRSGSTGIVSSVPEAWDGFAMSEHVIRIVPNPEKLDPAYLEVYLRSEIGQSLLARGIFGSVIDEITPEHIAAMPVPLPKDSETLAQIIQLQADASESRQHAISLSNDARRLFEQSVGGQFATVREDAGSSLPREDVVDQSEELVEGEIALKGVRPRQH